MMPAPSNVLATKNSASVYVLLCEASPWLLLLLLLLLALLAVVLPPQSAVVEGIAANTSLRRQRHTKA
jgi:hypothetical protein